MKEEMKFDYYYGIETEQFSFYRVPRLLIKEACFKKLSSDAKLLYGLMLDRLSLSRKNGWFDQEERAYIYYTVDTIMEDLGCAKATCSKILAELDSKKGIGLIERIRQGLGKPDRIYVKNFATLNPTNPEDEVKEEKLLEEEGRMVQQEVPITKKKRETQKKFLEEKKELKILEKENLIECSEIEIKQECSFSEKEDEQEVFLCENSVQQESLEVGYALELNQKREKMDGFGEIAPIKQKKEAEVLEKREESLIQAEVLQEVQKLNFKRYENQQLGNSNLPLAERQEVDFQSSKKQTSRSTEIELLKVQNLGTSYNERKESDLNQNKKNEIHSIYPIHPISSSRQGFEKARRKETREKGEMDGNDQMEEVAAYRELIQEQIDYQHYMGLEGWKDRALYEELYEVICEVVCVKHKTVRIGGESYPYEWVKAKFLKLNSQHLQYVMDRMQHITSKILNIKAYLLTALYNAPNTMNYFYQQEVNYDMLGGGWKEKGII